MKKAPGFRRFLWVTPSLFSGSDGVSPARRFHQKPFSFHLCEVSRNDRIAPTFPGLHRPNRWLDLARENQGFYALISRIAPRRHAAIDFPPGRENVFSGNSALFRRVFFGRGVLCRFADLIGTPRNRGVRLFHGTPRRRGVRASGTPRRRGVLHR